MKLDDFFELYKIFTLKELANTLSISKGFPVKSSTLYNLLAYHQKQGHILHIRRGLYYSIPKGSDPNNYPVNPFLVASKMAEDAVIAYGSALDLHGKLHTIQNRFIYLTKKRVMASFDFRDVKYQAVAIPSALKATHQETFGVQPMDLLGQKVLVTSLERTLVDVLDRPYLCGSWEEIWLSLESIEYLDMDQVLKYALLLANSTTIARIAFFLDEHREMFGLTEKDLFPFDPFKPKSPHYLDRHSKEPNQLIARWNLIVPKSVLYKSWEEPYGNFSQDF